MKKIKIAIVGIGNCASALVQGIHYYRGANLENAIGLMHGVLGGYRPEDIEVVAAYDVDRRKVGQDLNRAVFAEPNCAQLFCADLPEAGLQVKMGRTLDGVSAHMADYGEGRTFLPADAPEPDKADVVRELKETEADVLVNYLPVGSEQATRFYAECALEAGTAFINNIPVFIASDPVWARRFEEKNIPIIGDDIKSQLGATITHRVLTDLFKKRGVKLDRTYQLNTGGNTDFLNMINRDRLASKKISKTEAVQSVTEEPLSNENIHIGPSDYVPWQKDNKVCFIRMEGRIFGNVPINLEMRLSVEDSPNSAGVAIDTIRCAKLALDRNAGGVLCGPSAYFCKHPLMQFTDDEAHAMTENFIQGKPERKSRSCLIIAAGQGSRLRSRGASKPLTPIFGIPLIERVIVAAQEAGANDFYVVTGYREAPLKAFLAELSQRLGLRITPIENPDWEKGNGLSVLKGKPFFQEPFLLLMSDHLFDPAIARTLLMYPIGKDEIVLGVDRDGENPLVDLKDVTRVKTDAGRIRAIGKGIEDYDAFDTGAFLCGPGLFETLERCAGDGGDTSLSRAIQMLADDNRAFTADITGRFWIDVDDPASFKRAENALLAEFGDSQPGATAERPKDIESGVEKPA